MSPHPKEARRAAAGPWMIVDFQGRLKAARALARGGWALISCSLGGALVLAQYASLTDRDPHPFNVLAKVIASGGSGLALLSWLWSGIIYYRLRREGYQPHPAAGASGCSFIFFILWLALAVGGVVVMSAGGNADSTAPPALIALGLGCACTIAGFLGLIQTWGRWFTNDLREDRRVVAEVRATAIAQGRKAPSPSRALTVFSALGYIVAAAAMVGCYEIAPWLAAELKISLAVVEAAIFILGVLVAFPALVVFVNAHTITHQNVTPQEARSFSYGSAALATAGVAAIGILTVVRLGFLVILVFIGLAYLANKLRRRYLSRQAGNLPSSYDKAG
jgi:hypothetical protein